MTTIWIDSRWKDELKDLEVENEVLRENERRLKRQLEQRTEAASKAVEAVTHRNDELEAEMAKSQAQKDFEAGKITLKEMILRDFGGGREPETAEDLKEQESAEGSILQVFGHDLDQPAQTDVKRLAVHEGRRRRANFNAQMVLQAMAKGSAYERALRGELPQGNPNTPGTPAWTLARAKEKRERELRERSGEHRHLYSG